MNIEEIKGNWWYSIIGSLGKSSSTFHYYLSHQKNAEDQTPILTINSYLNVNQIMVLFFQGTCNIYLLLDNKIKTLHIAHRHRMLQFWLIASRPPLPHPSLCSIIPPKHFLLVLERQHTLSLFWIFIPIDLVSLQRSLFSWPLVPFSSPPHSTMFAADPSGVGRVNLQHHTGWIYPIVLNRIGNFAVIVFIVYCMFFQLDFFIFFHEERDHTFFLYQYILIAWHMVEVQ